MDDAHLEAAKQATRLRDEWFESGDPVLEEAARMLRFAFTPLYEALGQALVNDEL